MRLRRKPWARPELAACPFFVDHPEENRGRWREQFPREGSEGVEEALASIRALIAVVNSRDMYTFGHTERVVYYADMMARQLALPPEEAGQLVYAAYVHDVGKINIPKEVLLKPIGLTDEEWGEMKRHPEEGAYILQNLPSLAFTAELVRHHHERYDGSGYPDGLKGEEIPISAQVVALADVYDALVSKRVYKPAFSHEKAQEMILNGECGAFNPILLDCLKDISKEIKLRYENDEMK